MIQTTDELEVSAVIPPEQAKTREQAEQHVEVIRQAAIDSAQGLERLRVALETAWKEQHFKVLGFDTWDDYYQANLAETIDKINSSIRREWVPELRAEGMSLRILAAISGVSYSTLSRDSTVANATPEIIQTANGRNQPAVKAKPTPRRKPLTADQVTYWLSQGEFSRGTPNRLWRAEDIDAGFIDGALIITLSTGQMFKVEVTEVPSDE